MTRLPLQINEGPVFFPLLQVGSVQLDSLISPEAASEQYRRQCSITFYLLFRRVRSLPKRFALFRCQPIAQTHPSFLTPFTRRNPRGKIRAQETALRGFIGEPPYRTQPQIDGAGS